MAKDKLNLEQLSDSELNEYLRRIEDQRNAVPSEQQLAGGAAAGAVPGDGDRGTARHLCLGLAHSGRETVVE